LLWQTFQLPFWNILIFSKFVPSIKHGWHDRHLTLNVFVSQ
jgi:hypothetical protein